MKEVNDDARELVDELVHGVPDTSHHMRKVCLIVVRTYGKGVMRLVI